MTLGELNRCDREQFIEVLGWIFEDSPWVAERAWTRRPFASLDDLHAAMVDAVKAAEPAEQLALLRAHPDLATRAPMSDASQGEQAGAGLNQLASDDLQQMNRLTAEYRERFGFPFLLAVKGRTRQEVLDALTRRLAHAGDARGRDAEKDVALEEVFRITSFRLHDASSDRFPE